jgi:hypothetical protein
MCTVSWLQQDGGYQLFCNRDEKKTRPLARAPEVVASGGVRFIAPIDPAAGGTWVAVNEYGLSLCLLNATSNRSANREAPLKSRGHIVMELATAACVAEACERDWKASLPGFAPFRLVLLERSRPAAVMTWDGASKSIAFEEGALLSSSSVDDPGALRARQQEFRRVAGSGATGAEVHRTFHRSHGRRANACSPCMHRLDAETVSFTCVQVTSSEIVVHYSPASPCRNHPAQICRLLGAS